MIDALFVDEQVILAATAPLSSVTAVMNLATLHKTGQIIFLPKEHHATRRDLVPGYNASTHKRTDNTPPTMDTDIGDISTDHNHSDIPTRTGAATATEDTHHTPHPVTAAAQTTL